jgi:hypothetical protein
MKSGVYTHMRTNIEINDKLMKDALRAKGDKTKREVVEMARPGSQPTHNGRLHAGHLPGGGD